MIKVITENIVFFKTTKTSVEDYMKKKTRVKLPNFISQQIVFLFLQSTALVKIFTYAMKKRLNV